MSKDPQIDFNISFSGGDIEFKSVPNQHLFYNSFELFLQKFVVFYKQNGDLYLSQISKNTETNDRYNVANTAVKVSGDMDNYQKNIYCDIVKAIRGDTHRLASGSDALTIRTYLMILLEERN